MRACSNPEPANGGEMCNGSKSQHQDCVSVVPCPGEVEQEDGPTHYNYHLNGQIFRLTDFFC